jgi:deoxyxylulose-5-phosphate synthase
MGNTESVSKRRAFSSSLGVNELTVALHYVFDMPEDDIILGRRTSVIRKILTVAETKCRVFVRPVESQVQAQGE